MDQNQHLMIAMADPLNIEAYDAVLNILQQYCPRILCPPAEIDKAISRCYYHELGAAGQQHQPKNPETDFAVPKNTHEDLLNISGHAPIVRLVNTILNIGYRWHPMREMLTKMDMGLLMKFTF